MRIFMTRVFAKFAHKEQISHESLIEAVLAAEIRPDADLGGGIIEQRVARRNQGKSGGYRTIIALRFGDIVVFLHGFAKNQRENISRSELHALKKLVAQYLASSSGQLETLLALGKLLEVQQHEQEIQE
jgi:hypothetical protein